MLLSVRSFALSTALLVGAASASATGLTLPVNTIQANSVLTFSDAALASFKLRFIGVTITPLGNTTAVPNANGVYSLPITSITLSGLKVAGGAAKGSALQITRTSYDANFNDVLVGMTLANFTINYNTKQVLADATPLHGTTIPQLPLYNFNVATPLALKYQFPLSIVGHEVLDKLFLTPQAKAFFLQALDLPLVASGLLDTTDFGTLTQDINSKLRKPVSAKPYVPAP